MDELATTWFRKNDKSYAYAGDYSYAVRSYSSDSVNVDWLVTDGFYFEKEGCYKLTFQYRNYYSRENLKLYMGKTYDPEDMTEQLFQVEMEDYSNKLYSQATIYINVEETGIYYLGFLTDHDMQYRYYVNLDDFSVQKIDRPTPDFDFNVDVLYNRAVLNISDTYTNVKHWKWEVEDSVYADQAMV